MEQNKQQQSNGQAGASFVSVVSSKLDILSDIIIGIIGGRVPSIKADSSSAARKLLIFNTYAVVMLIFAFSHFPALVASKYEISTTFSQLISFAGGFGGSDVDGGAAALISCAQWFDYFLFMLVGLSIFTLSTNRMMPIYTCRLISILQFVLFLLVFIFIAVNAEELRASMHFMSYITLLISLVVGFVGAAIKPSGFDAADFMGRKK